MGVMEVLTALLTITLPLIGTLVPTIVLTNRQTQCLVQKLNLQTQKLIESSNRQTQRIIQNSNRQTLKLLREIKGVQREIKQVQEDIACTLKKIRRVQADTNCLFRKLDFGFKANAAMHGWKRLDNIPLEKAREIPEPKVHDPKLRVSYFKVR